MEFFYDRGCLHEWGWLDPTQTTGKNILGQKVSCWGQDGVCKKCNATTWRKIEKETINEHSTEGTS